jgi:hypothetical protein
MATCSLRLKDLRATLALPGELNRETTTMPDIQELSSVPRDPNFVLHSWRLPQTQGPSDWLPRGAKTNLGNHSSTIQLAL